LFEQFDVSVGRPYVWWYARTIRSAPPFDAEYGEISD
jgi:hypothetical protein